MKPHSPNRVVLAACTFAVLALSLSGLTAQAAETSQLGGLSTGPDVTIFSLSGVSDYSNGEACPAGYAGDCRGYAIGTDSCNIGSVSLDWCDPPDGGNNNCRSTTDAFHPLVGTNSDHPVIAQNLYRLKNGRFEQIGLSFLKHGFFSTNSGESACMWNDNGTPNPSCEFPPAGGSQLGVGCTDFYGSSLNGSRPLGRRSDVVAAGGDHPTDPAGGETNDNYDQRVLVSEEDIDPAQNPGALYFVEGHYVVRDDARAGNGLNNASYRAANIGSMPGLNMSLTGSTVRELPAIFAWQAQDPGVEIVQADRDTFFTGEAADVPATGQTHPDYTVTERFHAARRVTEPAEGPLQYHYEYTIYNMNSDTCADGFTIDFPGAAAIANAGFRDIDHHSGEPYDTADWSVVVDEPNGSVTWGVAPFKPFGNSNALRWGTSFSFWFDSDTPPTTMAHTLDLFKIDEDLDVPFPSKAPNPIFDDGFEAGNTDAWSSTTGFEVSPGKSSR